MKSTSRIQLSVLAMVVLFVGFGTLVVLRSHAANCGQVSAKLVPSCGAWFGSYEGYASTAYTSKEAELGRKFDLVHIFTAWDTKIVPNADQISLATGGRFLYANVEARISTGGGTCWSDIASGSQDAAIDSKAASVKAFGKPMFMSFMHEPEDNVGTSCDIANNKYGTAAQFAAAFRHFHDRFAADGVTNIVWVWTMMGNPQSADPASLYAALWPGDSYVDWVAYDPYDWYTCHNIAWKDFYATASNFYNWFAQNSAAGHDYSQKPYMIAETGALDDPANATNKQNWFKNMPAQMAQLPNIKAVVYFDSNTAADNAGNVCDWLWDNTQNDLAGFKAAGADPYFNQPHTSTPITPTTTPMTITGDINGDGKVNTFDLSALLSAWGTSSPSADLNHDGTVNISDLSALLSHWSP